MTAHGADDRSESCEHEGRLGSFVRSLLSGIPWSESATANESLLFDLPSGGVVDVHNANGKTRVVGEERDDVVVHARKHARAESGVAAEQLLQEIRVVGRHEGGALDIDLEIPRKWNRHGSVDLEIRVPRELHMQVSSSNGKLCLQGLRCAVKAHSSNGSVRIRDIVGDIEIATANAKVSCECTSGRLVARSCNSKIEVAKHRGSIDASTSNGLIKVNLEQLSSDGVTLTTSNGRIVLELPESPDAEVDIRVDNGVIRNDLALVPDATQSNGRLHGRIGRGGTPIKLRTSNGTVSLR